MSELENVDRERALDACKRLKVSIDDTVTMLDRIEATRRQASLTGDEIRDQVRIIKDRVNWVIRELDLMRKQLGKTTRPGDPA